MWSGNALYCMKPIKTFFEAKTIDVKVAKSFRWDNIAPSLPAEVGQLDLKEFCEQGVLQYVSNFEDFLLPAELQTIPKPPRVLVDDPGWAEVCEGLVSKGFAIFGGRLASCGRGASPKWAICDELFTKEDGSSHEVMRLIMNLVPLNNLCKPLVGDTPTLPLIQGMITFFWRRGRS